MRAPRFWQVEGPLPWLLTPLGSGYAALGWLRWRLRPQRTVSVPVLCVGNATVGGTGKTPIVLDLLQRLRRRGVAAHGLCRGHGGRLRGPVRVDPALHGARDVGDEALLLAAVAPTWAGRDRLAAAQLAIAAGAQAIVLDDGLQYPRLAKTWSLLVVDARTGLGNGRVLPAGPLREPLARALSRSDAVVVVGKGPCPGLPAALDARPRLVCRLVPTPAMRRLRDRRVVAFAGIGRPEKLFETARACGAVVVAERPFPDHHVFTAAELGALLVTAHELDARLLTTSKDHVRLPPALRDRVDVLAVEVAWDDEKQLERLLDDLFTVD